MKFGIYHIDIINPEFSFIEITPIIFRCRCSLTGLLTIQLLSICNRTYLRLFQKSESICKEFNALSIGTSVLRDMFSPRSKTAMLLIATPAELASSFWLILCSSLIHLIFSQIFSRIILSVSAYNSIIVAFWVIVVQYIITIIGIMMIMPI